MGGVVESSLDGHVALLRLNRPEARNALSPEVMERLGAELEQMDPNPEVRCIVIAGSDQVFAAGRRHQGDERAHLCRGPPPPCGGVLEAPHQGQDLR